MKKQVSVEEHVSHIYLLQNLTLPKFKCSINSTTSSDLIYLSYSAGSMRKPFTLLPGIIQMEVITDR